ncbi:hypothetical protein [Coxiella endosymbiont of Ornithodoros amblus]|uniref:hypothetical protein n=1 Tax=Coxiella endosymbiont of Ornithodoros amblus TaxID=1656166 RepID=UPI00244DABB7|nr:hypothetical protein [Coxiella endosymbiont of Ornithodoros amblus]
MRNDTNNANSKVEVEVKSAKPTSVDNRESEAFLPMKFRMDNLVGLFNLEDKLGLEEEILSREEMKMGPLF